MGALEAVGQVARLISTILEGIAVEQRQATAMAVFWILWPVLKLNPEVANHEKEILAAMERIGKADVVK